MAPNTCKTTKKYTKKGTWTAEEDHKLAEYIKTHGATKWKLVVTKTGLNRCEKSCRLRWLNYLRPSIKRGTFTDQEDDLILRLHKLLGNRWALIAGRIPGRTDNDIKNYWNSHLSKKLKDETTASSLATESQTQSNEPTKCQTMEQELANEPTESHGKEQVEEGITKESRDLFDFSEPFPSMEDFSEPFPSTEDSTKFLELDDYFLGLL